MKSNNQKEPESGIVLLAKKFGKTSFASLSSVKHALKTSKVGHTGTLDSFADGLLVVLSGRLTRLVPHITNFDKKYVAFIEFGSETDTLDPTGKIINSSEKIPTKEEVETALKSFEGEIEQVPPLFSALHIDGKRASDLAREGKTAEIPARKITIFGIKLLDFKDKYALVEVHCSKGTYIRSLARDIAYKCGTFAHLEALRRTSVGPFELKDATGFDELDEFTIDSLLKNPRTDNIIEENINDEDKQKKFEIENEKIKSNLKTMNYDLAEYCGMSTATLSSYFVESYSHGKPLNSYIFSNFFSVKNNKKLPENSEIAIFYPKGKFAGVITKKGKYFSYGFVIPQDKKFVTYSWDDIISGRFSEEFKNKGTALTIGSFDGPHIGHDALFDSAIAQKEKGLISGVITFTKSLRVNKNPETYPGDIASLSQKLNVLSSKGFDFAVVIDFSPEFARIEGIDFFKILVDFCGLKHLSEGRDFHCGYKGSADMNVISDFSKEFGFFLQTVEPVMYQEKRISSSRIRECILKADFNSVKYMLERPFAIDCTKINWKSESDTVLISENLLKSKKIVLPPNGNYKVRVIFSAGSQNDDLVCNQSGKKQLSLNVKAYRSDCMLENGILRLSFSDKLINGFVLAIQFDCSDVK